MCSQKQNKLKKRYGTYKILYGHVTQRIEEKLYILKTKEEKTFFDLQNKITKEIYLFELSTLAQKKTSVYQIIINDYYNFYHHCHAYSDRMNTLDAYISEALLRSLN